MSINVNVGNIIPTNVVEVGNEISADQLAAITAADSPSATNPFATASHIHTIANISGLQTELNKKIEGNHTQSISSITNLQNILDSKSSVSHTHGIGEVSGLRAELDSKASIEQLSEKANVVHSHSISDVTGLQTELDGKMVGSNNLSEIVDDSIARDNLGMGEDAILKFNSLEVGGVTCVDGIGNELNLTSDGIVFPDGTVQSTAATSQTFRIEDYDNGKTYNAGDQIVFSDKIYKFNAFIGAAGYAPDTHPEAWTELSAGQQENGPFYYSWFESDVAYNISFDENGLRFKDLTTQTTAYDDLTIVERDNSVGYAAPLLATQFAGATSGTGALSDHFNAITNTTNSATRRLFAPTTAVGYANQHLDLNIIRNEIDHFTSSPRLFDWSKNIRVSFNMALGSFAAIENSNTGFGMRIGHLSFNGIEMTGICKSIGLKKVGNGPLAIVYCNNNNGNVVEVPTNFYPNQGIVYNYEMCSDGLGNFTLWVDGVVCGGEGIVAPTGMSTTLAQVSSNLIFAVENKASVTTRASAVISFVKISITNQ